jgi:lysozyme family protein
MKDNWDKSFELMLASEGGFANHPSDPGGMTNLGVTKATWENWVGRQSDESEMRGLTPDKVEPLYKKKYWDAVRGDELPIGLDYLVFDFAVNAGAGRAIKTLQTALGVTADGGFGPITLKEVQTVEPANLIERFSKAKETFYQSLTQFPTFGKGWLNRVAKVKINAFSMLV